MDSSVGESCGVAYRRCSRLVRRASLIFGLSLTILRIDPYIQCARRREDGAEVVSWASTPELSARWRKCGFHPRAEDPVLVRQRGGLELPSRVHLQMLDTDAAYLHQGVPGLWA